MKVGIIGGGLSGLALAQRLGSQGHSVTIFEQATQPGGLATYQDHGPFVFDRYYHVILPSDRYLMSFIREIGLGDELRWETTLTGFWVDRQMHSVSSSLEFLKFKPLSLWSKFRLAMTILYCSRINDWKRLEKITVEDFLLRHSGRTTYEKMWKPLLLAKLGESYKRVSAVFIWTYIKRMFSARDSSASKEQMGHVRGGYKTIFDRLEEVIPEQGGQLRLGSTVSRIEGATQGSGIDVVADGNLEHFDKVIFTGPVNVLEKVADEKLITVEESGHEVEYLGVMCMALVTRKPLTGFYILNVADERIPFTGVVGMSNILDPGETAGTHLTYLPKYVLSTDEELRRPESELREEFIAGLRLMFPDLSDDDIVSDRIYRAIKVQPLQVLGFSELIPKTATRHPDFYVHNTAQFVNNTLNNNAVIQAVDAFMERYGSQFSGVAGAAQGNGKVAA
jgi:protoporphyrinogen oxidase